MRRLSFVICAVSAGALADGDLAQGIKTLGAFFDLPMAHPPEDKRTLAIELPVSFFPKAPANEYLGNLPAVHALPVLRAQASLREWDDWDFQIAPWVGALAIGSELVSGSLGHVGQIVLGSEFLLERKRSDISPYVSIASQMARIRIWNMSHPNAQEINLNTEQVLLGGGARFHAQRLWASLHLGLRRVDVYARYSELNAAQYTDNGSDNSFPLSFLAQLGYTPEGSPWGFTWSQIWVPDRVLLPRIAVTYAL